MGLCCGSDRFVSLSLQNSKPADLPKTPLNLLFNALSLGMKVRGATKVVSLASFGMRSVGSQRISSSASKRFLWPVTSRNIIIHGLQNFSTYLELLQSIFRHKMRNATSSHISRSLFSKVDLVHQLHATFLVCSGLDQQAFRGSWPSLLTLTCIPY
jgi:hypothetical protein